jgi:hypothetical protein
MTTWLRCISSSIFTFPYDEFSSLPAYLFSPSFVEILEIEHEWHIFREDAQVSLNA